MLLRVSCHQLHALSKRSHRHPSSGPSQLTNSPTLSLTPPHSTQGKLSTQAARDVRLKRKGEGSSSKPGAHCPAERGELSPTFVLSDGSGIGQDHWYLLCSTILF